MLECEWNDCPGFVNFDRSYYLDQENARIAIKTNDYTNFCTIIGNTVIPLDTITSWYVKFTSVSSDAQDVFIGVVPSDVNQDDDEVFSKYGWYFDFYGSKLASGPPHNYTSRKYGVAKPAELYPSGQWVCVGVVMDTMKGRLSFVVNGVSLGLAYDDIPLDVPLVPSAILRREDARVEIDPSEVVASIPDGTVPVPSGIVALSDAWDTLVFEWAYTPGTWFYQVEFDGSKYLGTAETNKYKKEELFPGVDHYFRVRAVRGCAVSEWSEVVTARTSSDAPWRCAWKECPKGVDTKRRYDVQEEGGMVAQKTIMNDYEECTIIGNARIPIERVTAWNIRIRRSKRKNGEGVYIGVAPSDISQNEDNIFRCGWYYDCWSSTLNSGPPHNFRKLIYGPKKGDGRYVANDSVVGVVMDTINWELSFVLDDVNFGVAYEGIPLDKPLVPCVILRHEHDTVEFNFAMMTGNHVDPSIPPPLKVSTVVESSDSIALTWDPVPDASAYQIEVDGSKFLYGSVKNKCVVPVIPELEHVFRVRAVVSLNFSEWSAPVARIARIDSFAAAAWKRCPEYVKSDFKYVLDEENSRIATCAWNSTCISTIIGNAPIPPNSVTSWTVKFPKNDDDYRVNSFVGVAPADINQDEKENFTKCGWYFYCLWSVLVSGPPHCYQRKDYGPRKDSGHYLNPGDSVGVVMDTMKGELSFLLGRVHYGLAYEGIPLDKPLVPCVIINGRGFSVRLNPLGVKDVRKPTLPAPANVAAKTNSPHSVVVSWDAVEGAEFYQVEAEGVKYIGATAETKCTMKGFVTATGYNFRVRAAKKKEFGTWSNYVKEYTQKITNEFWGWADYPPNKPLQNRYFVDSINPKIARNGERTSSTIIGGQPIPPNRVTSWGIKILSSEHGDCESTYIGVAPSDINQTVVNNYLKCGWYLDCFNGTLNSGGCKDYKGVYAPKEKREGKYVRTGDVIGVEVDMVNKTISFVMDGVKKVAFENISVDKPLVPCVILKSANDSILLITESDRVAAERAAKAASEANGEKDKKGGKGLHRLLNKIRS